MASNEIYVLSIETPRCYNGLRGDAAKQRYASLGIDIEEVKEQLLKVNNLALEGKPEDLVITSHICRGNYHSTYFTSGAYDSVADYAFARENVDALFLEYDDESFLRDR